MIHKKKHPEYKYRPKKRKHLKRPTGKVTTIVFPPKPIMLIEYGYKEA